MNSRLRVISRLAVAVVAAVAVVGGGVAQAAISVDPMIPVAGESANYTTDAPDAPSCNNPLIVLSCVWDFSAGPDGSGASATHTYAAGPPSRQVTFTITYADLVTPDYVETRTVDINQARPGVPTVTGPAVVQAGGPATFTASSEPGSSFDWSVDGGPATNTGGSFTPPTLGAGSHTISAVAIDDQGASSLGSGSTAVFVNQPPTASFVVSPLSPTAGQTVTFISTSVDPDGDALTPIWDLDGDNVFTDAIGAATTSTVYSTAGSRTVGLQVTDSHGATSAPAFSSVDVAPAPTTPSISKKKKSSPKLLSPFPRVRYAGRLTSRGVEITLFAVRTPKGAKIKATCAQRCPAKAFTAKAKATKDLILKKLQGTYRSGAILRISITKKDRIGKYTQISIPSGGAPRRSDKCLYPTSKKPRKCP